MGITEAIAREASDVTDEIQNAITQTSDPDGQTWEQRMISYAMAQNA